jgi:TRAP-type C4-dicarboxylate transport system permease small subunit
VTGFGMASIVGAQVFFRYVLNHSLFWSEELARYLLVWLTFLGASVAYHRGLHPGIDFLYRPLPPSLKKAASVCVHICCLTLYAVLLVFGCKFSYFVRLQISPALYLPKWIIYMIIPLSSAVLMIHALAFLQNELKKPKR